MMPEEMTRLQTIVLTLADPRGNWQFALESLCKMADMDPEKYRAHFAAHPIEPGAAGHEEAFGELVDEIRAQGFDEPEACALAVRIGGTPEFDEKGNVVVRRGDGKVLATLKPLKFFRENRL